MLVTAGSPEDLECDPTGIGGVAASLLAHGGHAGEAGAGPVPGGASLAEVAMQVRR